MKKKIFFGVAAALCVQGNVFAVNPSDTLSIIKLKEVNIIASRANEKTPIAFTNVSANQLSKINYGQDVPYLLSSTPSVITTSDAGNGIGYTSMRVRGTDGTRINITANGVPLNDAESHNLYWVNMSDFASSVKDIQIQRGAGTSTNGAGAFGASVNMATEFLNYKPSVNFLASYGSYNSHKETLKVSSGLLNNHWLVDARLSNIGSDGYIDRASVALNSFFLQGGYVSDKTIMKLIAFGGKEKTYHAWNYASKEEMFTNGRTYNSCGEYYDEDGNRQYYKDQNDNYQQYNFQYVLNQKFNNALSLNATLHYTKGIGYYEEYKTKRTVKEYNFDPTELGTKKSDLVRKKKMDNDFGGGLLTLSYNKGRVNAQFGGAANYYDGLHNGEVKWIKVLGLLPTTHEYYRNTGTKFDANVYARANVDLFSGVSAFGDVQYRHINYKITGANDNYDYGTSAMQELNINDKFNFVNPKVGLNWKFMNSNRLYASFSLVQKEPTRNNYTDGYVTKYPKAEKLYDYELGYNYTNNNITLGANLYYMWYKDQLVLTGAINEIGEAVAENVPESYRMGVELSAEWRPVDCFSWSANATFSRNRINNYSEIIQGDEWGSEPIVNTYKDTQIAFSPNVIFNNSFSYHKGGFEAMFSTQYVSKQYMNNVKCDEQVLDAYCVSNLHLAYNFKVYKVNNLRLGLSIYNIFNEEYENNGYAGAGYYEDGGEKKVYRYAGYAAQAPTNFMGSVALTF